MAMTRYPVRYEIARPSSYNRWTVAFRLILGIPQTLLVGGVGVGGINFIFGRLNGPIRYFGYIGGGGALGAVLFLLVFFAWWVILFTGRYPAYRDFCLMIYRWQQNVAAYMSLLAAPYPPFGEGPYPLQLEVIPAEEHNRVTVAFRVFLIIPHIVVLFFLGLAAWVVTIIAWFTILFTGEYPEGMYNFSVGVSRWGARVSAYMLLFVDDYPPFSLASEPDSGIITQPA